MSNIFPPEEKKIPTPEEERPIYQLNGVVLANPAYHCRPRDLWPNDIAEAKPEWIRWLEVYLANFCRPVQSIAKEVKCVACDSLLTGAYAVMNKPTHWRAVRINEESPTKEGRCSECGYPLRCFHEMKMPDGRVIVRLANFPLCYHPSATERMH